MTHPPVPPSRTPASARIPRPALAALAALATVVVWAPPAATQDDPMVDPASAAPVTFEGAAFDLSFDEADDLEVSETGSGQVHFLEVRRSQAPADGLEPLLKLLLVPAAAGALTPQTFLDALTDELIERRQAVQLSLRSTGEVRRVLLGEPRTGRRCTFGQAFETEHFDLFTVPHGEGLIGVLAKVEDLDAERCERALDRLLSSLTVKPIDPTTTRTERIGPFSLEVPLLVAEGRQDQDGVQMLQLGFAEGMLELIHQRLSAPWEAAYAAGSFAARREGQIIQQVEAQGGSLEPTQWTGLWLGGGLADGSRLPVTLADGATTEVLSYGLHAGRHMLGLAYEAPPQLADAMHARVRSLVGTLAVSGPSEAGGPLQLDLGPRQMIQDLGLSWVHPGALDLAVVDADEPGAPTRLSLRSPLATRAVHTEYFVDVHAAPLPAGAEPPAADPAGRPAFSPELRALEDELERLARAAYPDAQLGERWEIASDLLGARRRGLTLGLVADGQALQLSALVAPHRGGVAVAGALYPTADAGAALWTLANLLADLQPLPDGERPLTSADWTMTFDPAAWSLETWLEGGAHGVTLTQRGGPAWVELHTRDWPGPAAQRGFEALVARAEVDLDQRLAGAAAELGLPVSAGLASARERRAAPLGGTLAVRERLKLRPADDATEQLLDTWVLRSTDKLVTVRTRGLPDATGALDALLATLALSAPLALAPDLVLASGVELDVPPGSWATAYSDLDAIALEVFPRLGEGPTLVVRSSVVEPGTDPAAAIEVALETVLLTARMMAPGGAGTSVDAGLTGRFGGLELPRWRTTALDAEGQPALAIDLMVGVHEGVLYEVTLLQPADDSAWLADDLRAAAAAARLVPVVGLVEGAGDPVAAARREPLVLAGERLGELALEAGASLQLLDDAVLVEGPDLTYSVRLRSWPLEAGLNVPAALDQLETESLAGVPVLGTQLVRRQVLGRLVEGRRHLVRSAGEPGEPGDAEDLLWIEHLALLPPGGGTRSLTLELVHAAEDLPPGVRLLLDGLR